MSAILIASHDTCLLEGFKEILRGEGHIVYTASTCEAVFPIMRMHFPDLIILDMQLSGIHGLETFHSIQKIDTQTPVIILSAFETITTAIEARRRGAFDFMLKPLEFPDMQPVIRQALKEREIHILKSQKKKSMREPRK